MKDLEASKKPKKASPIGAPLKAQNPYYAKILILIWCLDFIYI